MQHSWLMLRASRTGLSPKCERIVIGVHWDWIEMKRQYKLLSQRIDLRVFAPLVRPEHLFCRER